MSPSTVFVLALAVFGASAQNFGSTGFGLGFNGFNGFNNFNGGCGSALASGPIVENVAIRVPGVIAPAAVQDTCNCVKTIVRPAIRKEVVTIPSVQRFVQTTSTPVVESIPYVTGSTVDVPSHPIVGGFGSGIHSGANFGFGSGFNGGYGIGGRFGC